MRKDERLNKTDRPSTSKLVQRTFTGNIPEMIKCHFGRTVLTARESKDEKDPKEKAGPKLEVWRQEIWLMMRESRLFWKIQQKSVAWILTHGCFILKELDFTNPTESILVHLLSINVKKLTACLEDDVHDGQLHHQMEWA